MYLNRFFSRRYVPRGMELRVRGQPQRIVRGSMQKVCLFELVCVIEPLPARKGLDFLQRGKFALKPLRTKGLFPTCIVVYEEGELRLDIDSGLERLGAVTSSNISRYSPGWHQSVLSLSSKECVGFLVSYSSIHLSPEGGKGERPASAQAQHGATAP